MNCIAAFVRVHLDFRPLHLLSDVVRMISRDSEIECSSTALKSNSD